LPESSPEVTVVVTTRATAADLVERAVASLCSQSLDAIEIVLVVDEEQRRMPPGLAGVIETAATDDRVRVLEPGRIGRGPALNLGVRSARAPLVAIQDADDESHARRLERQIDTLAMRADLDLLASAVRRVRGTDRRADWSLPEPGGLIRPIDRELLYRNPIVHSSIVVRRTALQQLGGYSETRPWQLDLDLYLRLRAAGGRLALLDEPLVLKRLHRDQTFEESDSTLARLWGSCRLQLSYGAREPLPRRYGYLAAALTRFSGRAVRAGGHRLRSSVLPAGRPRGGRSAA
jgi:glycosyltransferase involved in cell wall biosynthesis